MASHTEIASTSRCARKSGEPRLVDGSARKKPILAKACITAMKVLR
jgi:hypothetical protein